MSASPTGQPAFPHRSTWRSLSHSLALAKERELPQPISVTLEGPRILSGAHSSGPNEGCDEISELASEGDGDQPCATLGCRSALSHSACVSQIGNPTLDEAFVLSEPGCHVKPMRRLVGRRPMSKTAIEVFENPRDVLTDRALVSDADMKPSTIANTGGDSSLSSQATGALVSPILGLHSVSPTESRSSGEVFQKGRFTVTVASKRSPFTFVRKTTNETVVNSVSPLPLVASDVHLKRAHSMGAISAGLFARAGPLPSFAAARSLTAHFTSQCASSTQGNLGIFTRATSVIRMMGEQHHRRVRRPGNDIQPLSPQHCCYQPQAAGNLDSSATCALQHRRIRTVSPHGLQEDAYRLPGTRATGTMCADGRTGEMLKGVQKTRTKGRGSIEEVIASSSTGRCFTIVRRRPRSSAFATTGEATKQQLPAEKLHLDIVLEASIPPLMSSGSAPHTPFSTSALPCASPNQPPPNNIEAGTDEAPSVSTTISSIVSVRTEDSGYGTTKSISGPASSVNEDDSSAESPFALPRQPPVLFEGGTAVQHPQHVASMSSSYDVATTPGAFAAAGASESTIHGRTGRKFVITRERTI